MDAQLERDANLNSFESMILVIRRLRVAAKTGYGSLRIVFSTEHPIFTARLSDEVLVLDPHGRRARSGLGNSADQFAHGEHWFMPGVGTVHRPRATLIHGPGDAGLVLEFVIEPVARTGCVAIPTSVTNDAAQSARFFKPARPR